MKELNIETHVYDLGNKFRLEITKEDNYYQSWLYHENYCWKMYLIGTQMIRDLPEFIKLCTYNIDDDIAYFERKMFD